MIDINMFIGLPFTSCLTVAGPSPWGHSLFHVTACIGGRSIHTVDLKSRIM